MPTTYKVLGQVNPSANSDTTLYTVPGATQTVSSSLVICNQATTSAKFRIAIRPAGATLAAQHYLAYDSDIAANDTVSLTLGVTLGATDVITVRANSATVSFHAYGSEVA